MSAVFAMSTLWQQCSVEHIEKKEDEAWNKVIEQKQWHQRGSSNILMSTECCDVTQLWMTDSNSYHVIVL